jgi:hypothetical protein
MARPDNIDHFNRVVLHTFDRLYASFPVPLELKVAEVAELATPGSVLPDAPFSSLQPTYEAIRFLANEGFLKYANAYVDGSTFLQAQLTMKGLTVLGQTPDSLERKESLISRMRGLLTSGAKEVGSEAAKQLVSQAFTAAVVAAPGVTAILQQS